MSTDSKKSIGYLFMTGICMGAADVVPGVSGGTMAFIMGVYDNLLAAIKSVNLPFLKKLMRLEWKSAFFQIPWSFILPLLGGIGCAVVSLSKLLEYLLDHQQLYLMSFFFGLIVASIVALAARTTWEFGTWIAMVLGTAFAFWLVGLVPAKVEPSPMVLFFSGMLAISAMILPGISGSFILLIVGQYLHCLETLNRIIDALKDRLIGVIVEETITTVLPIGLGMVIGIMLFSRFLSWLLKSYGTVTVAVLIGFMIGSLRRIWPYKEIHQFEYGRHGKKIPTEWENVLPTTFDLSFWIAASLMVVGFFAISFLDHIQDQRNPVMRLITRSKNTPEKAAQN